MDGRRDGRRALVLADLVHALTASAMGDAQRFDEPRLPNMLVRSVFIKHFGTLPGEPPLTHTRVLQQGSKLNAEMVVRRAWELVQSAGAERGSCKQGGQDDGTGRSTDIPVDKLDCDSSENEGNKEIPVDEELVLNSFIEALNVEQPSYTVGTLDGDDLEKRTFDAAYELMISGLIYEATILVSPYIVDDNTYFPLIIIAICCSLAKRPFYAAHIIAKKCGSMLLSYEPTELIGVLVLLCIGETPLSINRLLSPRKTSISIVLSSHKDLDNFYTLLSKIYESAPVLPLFPSIILGVPADDIIIPPIPYVSPSNDLTFIATWRDKLKIKSEYLDAYAELFKLMMLPIEYCKILSYTCPVIPGVTLLVACGMFLSKEYYEDAQRSLSLAYDVLGARRVPSGSNFKPVPSSIWTGVLYALELYMRKKIGKCDVTSISDDELLALANIYAPNHPLTLFMSGKEYYDSFPCNHVPLELLSRDAKFMIRFTEIKHK